MKKVGLLFILILISACTPSESAINTAIANTQAALPTVTDTPVPTKTPTKTPKPNRTPFRTATPSDADYINQLSDRFNAYNAAYKVANDLMVKAANDSSLMSDEDWISALVIALHNLKTTANDLESIPTVSARFAQTDAYMKSIATETYLLIDNYVTWVDHQDLDALEQAVGNMKTINELMNKSINELDRITT